VITRPKYRTLSEALRRLWYRDRGTAIVLAGFVAFLGLIALLLCVGLPVAGVYLIAAKGIVRIVLGVVITLVGPSWQRGL
jgi:hypothetical protein